MSTLWQDVRFGIRSLRRSPGFTLTAVLVLAGAVAAITAVFSVVSVFLLRLLPFDEPETLVQIWQTLPEQGSELRVPLPNFLDWKARNTAFQDLGAYHYGNVLATDGEPGRITFARLTPNLLDLLGVEPLLGRTFATQENQPGRDHVVLLSESFWRSRYGASPGVVGRTLEVDGDPYTIIGVLPARFAFPQRYTQIWTPLPLDQQALLVVGRLAPGETLNSAQADLSRRMQALASA